MVGVKREKGESYSTYRARYKAAQKSPSQTKQAVQPVISTQKFYWKGEEVSREEFRKREQMRREGFEVQPSTPTKTQVPSAPVQASSGAVIPSKQPVKTIYEGGEKIPVSPGVYEKYREGKKKETFKTLASEVLKTAARPGYIPYYGSAFEYAFGQKLRSKTYKSIPKASTKTTEGAPLTTQAKASVLRTVREKPAHVAYAGFELAVTSASGPAYSAYSKATTVAKPATSRVLTDVSKRVTTKGGAVVEKGFTEASQKYGIWTKGFFAKKPKFEKTVSSKVVQDTIVKSVKGKFVGAGKGEYVISKGGEVLKKGELKYVSRGATKKGLSVFEVFTKVGRKTYRDVGKARSWLSPSGRTQISRSIQAGRPDRLTSGWAITRRPISTVSKPSVSMGKSNIITKTVSSSQTSTATVGLEKSMGRLAKQAVIPKTKVTPYVSIRPPTSSPTLSVQKTKTTTSLKTTQIQQPIQKRTITPASALSISPITKQTPFTTPTITPTITPILTQPEITKTPTRTILGTTTTPVITGPPQLTFGGSPPAIGFPVLPYLPSLKKGRKKPKKKRKMKKKYQPSLVAIEFGLKGSKPKKLTGLEIRPFRL